LTGKQRTYLRGLAHDLNPLLQVGKSGLTAALLEEIGRALDSHELIKLRMLRECPDDADGATTVLEKKLKANVVAKLGNILVLYRRNPMKQRIALPTEKKKATKAAAPEIPDDFEDDELDDELDDDSEEDE
jgi:RNA-binding protein